MHDNMELTSYSSLSDARLLPCNYLHCFIISIAMRHYRDNGNFRIFLYRSRCIGKAIIVTIELIFFVDCFSFNYTFFIQSYFFLYITNITIYRHNRYLMLQCDVSTCTESCSIKTCDNLYYYVKDVQDLTLNYALSVQVGFYSIWLENQKSLSFI